MIKVYTKNMELDAFLENASDVDHREQLNSIWTASFYLPADDPKNAHCQPFNYVEIFDDNKRVELYRIMPSSLQRAHNGVIKYECEHVLSTLIDKFLFGYHQIGNVGVYTPQVLRYIIDKQSDWKLGKVEFSRQFEYKWENETLLSAIMSVPKSFQESYLWTWDTNFYPWTLNLVAAETTPSCEIRYRKNMLGITKEVDPSNIVTKLYCLGFGEGDNQLTIKSVNNGVPYLLAKQEFIDLYGIKESIWIDRRFETPELLKAQGQAILNNAMRPYVSYKVSAIDTSKKSESDYDRFRAGKLARVIDEDDGIEFDAMIIESQKKCGDPKVSLEIANKSRDISGTMNEVRSKARINESYSQGATNLMEIAYADNADSNNPAVLRFYVPEEMVRINKLLLKYVLEPFRAYSKSAKGGGATSTSTGGGGATYSSTKGGGASVSATSAGGGTVSSTGGGGGTATSTSSGQVEVSTTGVRQYSGAGPGAHNHGISPGTRLVTEDGGSIAWTPSGNHDHDVNVQPHNHEVDIPDHSHSVNIPDHSHEVSIPEHTHEIAIKDHAHSVNIPEHTHEIEYGIYQGAVAQSAYLLINGVKIIAGNEVDLVPYLAKDSEGKIKRGQWHEVMIVPNKLTRISANIFVQIFVQSRGSGDY